MSELVRDEPEIEGLDSDAKKIIMELLKLGVVVGTVSLGGWLIMGPVGTAVFGMILAFLEYVGLGVVSTAAARIASLIKTNWLVKTIVQFITGLPFQWAAERIWKGLVKVFNFLYRLGQRQSTPMIENKNE